MPIVPSWWRIAGINHATGNMQLSNTAIWLSIGFAGQALFGVRFLVQWLCSEVKGKSIIPLSFWYFSVTGSAVLIVYAIHQSEPVFAAGEVLSFLVFSRNLQLVLRQAKRR